jgi:glutathione peroxidase-family protein
MRTLPCIAIFLLGALPTMIHAQEKKSIYDFQVTSIDGKKVDLAKYKGKVILIVNVASECGYTGQYKALQELHKKYAKDGLAILAFPCNDFGKQEPGDDARSRTSPRKTMASISTCSAR